MAKKLYSCNEVVLSHERVVELREAGDLNLGIDNDFSARLAQEKGLGPKKTTANAAFHFWNLVTLGVFAYTLYLSFIDAWWWGILGFVGCLWFYRMNKRGNADNYLDAAMIDKEFYERVQNLNGWIYQIEEEAFRDKLREEERPEVGQEIETANKVVNDFGKVMEELDWGSAFYDTACLPYPKKTILESIFKAYQLTDDESAKRILEGGLYALSYFQENVGTVPLRGMVDLTEVDFEDGSPEEYLKAQKNIDQNRYDELSQLANKEYQKYLEEVVP